MGKPAPQAAKSSAAQPAPAKPRKTMKFAVIYIGIVLFVSFVSLPGGMLLVMGSLPAVTCWFSDRQPGKPFGLCVALVNLGAVIFHLIRVLPHGHDFPRAMPMITDSLTWLSIYGCAFIGWGIYFGMPVLLTRMLTNRLRKKAEKIQERQQVLIDAWGRDIAIVSRENAG